MHDMVKPYADMRKWIADVFGDTACCINCYTREQPQATDLVKCKIIIDGNVVNAFVLKADSKLTFKDLGC